MPVTEVMFFPGSDSYYICPHCSLTMGCEFMEFCDRYEQHLGWKGCKKAGKVPGEIYDLEGRTLYHFKVIELHSLDSRRPSYGIVASVLENDVCTYAACIPDISCNKAFVEELAHRCSEGQLSPMHLLDVVLDALS